nr:MAG TPA: hypothetical protein [Caudoviricetes sp.]
MSVTSVVIWYHRKKEQEEHFTGRRSAFFIDKQARMKVVKWQAMKT